MAYRATLNGEVFFDTNSISMALGLSSAILNLKAGAAGEFNFKVPHINKAYNHFNLITDYIDVYRDNELIFSGRVSSIDMDFDGTMNIEAEGIMTVLNDTIFRPVLHEGNLHALLRKIIESHNSQVETAKQITIKKIDILDTPCYRAYENYESTYSRIEDLVDSFGGFISIRKENGVLYLYWEEITLLSEQTINFGENILSVDKESNSDDLITVLIPLGARIEDEETGEKTRLTIASVNSGLDYIELPNTTEKIVGVEIWDDVEVASNLLSKGRAFLNEQSKFKTTINVTAVDLADTGLDVEHFKVGKKNKVTSIPHGLDEEEFECLSQRLNLLSPADNNLTLGTVTDGFTVKANKEALLNTKLIEQIIASYATNARLNNIKTDVEQQVQENYTLIEQNSERIGLVAHQVEARAKIFEEEPSPPYTKGDLWYRGIAYDKGSAVPMFAIPGYAVPDVGGDLFICMTSRELGEDFNQNDWKATFPSQFREIGTLKSRVVNAEVEIDAAKGQINLNAEAIDYNKEEIKSAGIRIDALNTAINLKVDKTNYNAAEIALMINNAGSTVKIKADHIALEGLVTANNNFKINLDGSIEATNGKFVGTIESSNAIITGGRIRIETSDDTVDYVRFYYGNDSMTLSYRSLKISSYDSAGYYYVASIGSNSMSLAVSDTTSSNIATGKAIIGCGSQTATGQKGGYIRLYSPLNDDTYLSHSRCYVNMSGYDGTNYAAVDALNLIVSKCVQNNSQWFYRKVVHINGTTADMTFYTGTYDNLTRMVLNPQGISGGSIGLNNTSGTSSSRTITLNGADGSIRCVSLTQTSDENFKHDINPLNLNRSADFIYSLTPYEFRYNALDDHLHHGFTTGNVESTIDKIYGYGSDWGIISEPNRENYEDGSVYKSLAYNELIADIIATLQSQNNRLQALESNI